MRLNRKVRIVVSSCLSLGLMLTAGCRDERDGSAQSKGPMPISSRPAGAEEKADNRPESIETFKTLAKSRVIRMYGTDKPEPEWEVFRKDGRVFVRQCDDSREVIQKPPSVADAQSLIRGGQWRRVSDGWFQGWNHGEFGGGLEWYAPDGSGHYTVISENVHGIVELKSQLYVLTGLAHLVSDEGQVLKLVRDGKTGRWSAEQFVILPGAPDIFLIDDRGALIVVTTSSLVEVWPDENPRLLVRRARWGGLYPNSFVLASPETAYLGMRQAVVEITSLRTNPKVRFYIRNNPPTPPKIGRAHV